MIYLDNASTTKMYKEAIETYSNISNDFYFNASAMYNKYKKDLERKNLIQN